MPFRSPSSLRAVGYTCVLSLLALTGHAQEADPALARFRDQLRNLTLQLRTAQTEKAAVQAQLAESQQKEKSLQQTVDAQTKSLTELKDMTDQQIGQLQDKLTKMDASLTASRAEIKKWEAGFNEVRAVAEKKESERAALYTKSVKLEQKVAAHERKNLALAKVSKEILDRYEKFGLGTALAGRETFIGIARTKIETLVQDLGDLVEDNRIKPDGLESSGGAPADADQADTQKKMDAATAQARQPKTSNTQRVPGLPRTGRPAEQPKTKRAE